MKKEIKKIVFGIVFILVIFLSLTYNITTFLENSASVESRTVDFNIVNGDIFCKDNTVIKVKNLKYLVVPIINPDSDYVFFNNFEQSKWIDNLKDDSIKKTIEKYNYTIDVKINDRKIQIDIEDILSNEGKLKIDFTKYDFLKNFTKIYVNINASYKANDMVIGYNGNQIVKVFWNNCIYQNQYNNDSYREYYFDDFKNLTVNINSDVSINGTKFNIDSSKVFSNNNKSYTMKVKKVNQMNTEGIYIFLGENAINDINETSYIEEIKNINTNENKAKDNLGNNKEIIVIVALIISLVLFIISVCINYKKHTKKYNKNFEKLIEPVLAETIIDGKIDLKNLIMSAIIQLHVKGNIEIIDNKTIKLNNYNNLKEYEIEILNLIFPVGARIVTFEDINNIFKESTTQTSEFSKNLSSIKVKILNYLYDAKILSKKITNISRIISTLSILIMVNITAIVLFWETYSDATEWIACLSTINAFIIYIYWSKKLKQSSLKEEATKVIILCRKKRGSLAVLLFSAIPILFLMIFSLLENNLKLFLLTLIMEIVNIVIIIINSGNTLTKKGKEERLNLLELKNYINEYSLIKDRDLNSVVIWDEYLAYATAFGIPSKITSQIYEKWYNINITVQFIESLF